MNKINMIIAAFAAQSLLVNDSPIKTKERRKKQCLQCGAAHTHNNSFCSRECCKGYRK